MNSGRRAWVGAIFAACLAAVGRVSADDPAPEPAPEAELQAAPDTEPVPEPVAEPTKAPPLESAAATAEGATTPQAAKDSASPVGPKPAAAKESVTTNREAIALLYGFGFGAALIVLSLVARFRREMFGRAA
jgi:hypothetical protein